MSMPIYEYRCDTCSGNFEVLTSFAERDKAQSCPMCKAERTKVVVSSFASIGAAGSAPLDFGSPSAGGGGGCCGGGCGCGSGGH